MICPICPKNHEATYDYTNRNGNKVYKCELSSSIFLEDLTGYTFYIELDNKEKYCLYGSVHFNTEYTRVQLIDIDAFRGPSLSSERRLRCVGIEDRPSDPTTEPTGYP